MSTQCSRSISLNNAPKLYSLWLVKTCLLMLTMKLKSMNSSPKNGTKRSAGAESILTMLRNHNVVKTVWILLSWRKRSAGSWKTFSVSKWADKLNKHLLRQRKMAERIQRELSSSDNPQTFLLPGQEMLLRLNSPSRMIPSGLILKVSILSLAIMTILSIILRKSKLLFQKSNPKRLSRLKLVSKYLTMSYHARMLTEITLMLILVSLILMVTPLEWRHLPRSQ